MKWWIGGVFILLIVLFTLVVWREQKIGGACYEQRTSQNTENPVPSIENEQQSPQQSASSPSDSEGYLCRLITPANLPTVLLVFVGIGGVWAALSTLDAIKRQADIMESQKGILEQSVEVAKDNASAAKFGAEAANKNVEMFISKERARLRVTIQPPNFGTNATRLTTTASGRVAYEVMYNVRNCGPTTAFITESGCAAYYVPGGAIDIEDVADAVMFPVHYLQQEFTPNSPPLETNAFLFFEDEENTVLNEIRQSRLFLGIRGFIKYRDVFDRERITSFRYTWDVYPMKDLDGSPFSGEWKPSGPTEDNQET